MLCQTLPVLIEKADGMQMLIRKTSIMHSCNELVWNLGIKDGLAAQTTSFFNIIAMPGLLRPSTGFSWSAELVPTEEA